MNFDILIHFTVLWNFFIFFLFSNEGFPELLWLTIWWSWSCESRRKLSLSHLQRELIVLTYLEATSCPQQQGVAVKIYQEKGGKCLTFDDLHVAKPSACPLQSWVSTTWQEQCLSVRSNASNFPHSLSSCLHGVDHQGGGDVHLAHEGRRQGGSTGAPPLRSQPTPCLSPCTSWCHTF